MPYATIQDVQDRMPQFVLTETSKPTIGAAETFLTDVIAEFDVSAENMGYLTPVTGEKSLKIAKTIVAAGAIARILYARAAAVGGDAAVQSADRAQAQYDNFLKSLKDPKSPLELTDAVRTSLAVEKPGSLIIGWTDTDAEVLGSTDTSPRTTLDQIF